MTDLPDFHIPHAEKIEWMIEEHGWAIEPVAARPITPAFCNRVPSSSSSRTTALTAPPVSPV